MDSEAFVAWALDDTRTIEERYTVELLVEEAMIQWHVRHRTGRGEGWEAAHERNRQRFLNPAYDPRYSEEDLRRATEVLATKTTWMKSTGFQHRPLRDLQALRFLTALEEVRLGGTEVSDLGPLTEVPRLRVLDLHTTKCEDFHALARCAHLRELSLAFGVNWPEVAGLEALDQLETLNLNGNLLVFPRGLTWPRVRRGGLTCSPLSARRVGDLPYFPACEFLTLGGVERLDGIEKMPRLRNLTLTGPVRDFSPLMALGELTWLAYQNGEPLDVTPITRLPRLAFVSFQSQHIYGLDQAKPRDYAPLAEAPALRELRVTGCPPVETEVAAINAGLTPWDDMFLAPEPRALPSLKMIVAPPEKRPIRPTPHRGPEEPELIDAGLRECEGRWVEKFVARTITNALGHADWGTTNICADARAVGVTIESFGVVEKLPEIIETVRNALARLREDYEASVMIALISPVPEATPAQRQLEEQFRKERDDAESESRWREQREYLERLHRYELKKQEGSKVSPEEFQPPPPQPGPEPPWERETEDDDEGGGDVAIKKKPDPPPSWLDNEHPLADHYRLLAYMTMSEIWFMPHHRDVAVYLMRREPDLEMGADNAGR
jgi:hypothetical protein